MPLWFAVRCVSSAALKFGRGDKGIVGMTSSEGESFSFRSVVPVEGAVEVWMTGVEAEMRRTLAAVMKEGECCQVVQLPLAVLFSYRHAAKSASVCCWPAPDLGSASAALVLLEQVCLGTSVGSYVWHTQCKQASPL